jgi:hypothetical protein
MSIGSIARTIFDHPSADVIMPGGILVPKGAQVTVALHPLMVNPEHWKVRIINTTLSV